MRDLDLQTVLDGLDEPPMVQFTLTPLVPLALDLPTPPPSVSPVSIAASDFSAQSPLGSTTDPESILGLIQLSLHLQPDVGVVHQWTKAAFDHQDLILARQLWLYLHPSQEEHELEEVNDKNVLIQNILDMIKSTGLENADHSISINLGQLLRVSGDVLNLPKAVQGLGVRDGTQQYTCHYCQKNFVVNSNLKSHIRKYHEMDKGFICSYCGSLFGDSKNLKEHEQRLHFNEMDHEDQKMSPSDGSGGGRPHQCDQCHKAFTRKTRLKEHIHRIHLQESLNKTKCSFEGCASMFASKWLLKQHIAVVHWKEKAHECVQCGKKFGYAHHVVVHMKQIHGIKNPRKAGAARPAVVTEVM